MQEKKISMLDEKINKLESKKHLESSIFHQINI